ncbi:MAG: UTP--glucose-1-phosphate uridylyltransferase [Desulfobacteraceae bacterium]|nr:UTP--glucose-1-phosphate uridylyltransferase [Desulfobacteraceae bacterium]
MDHLTGFKKKMEAENLPGVVIDTFSHYYKQVVAGATGLISSKEIRPVTPGDIADYANLGMYTETGEQALEKTVMIVLNGGLGTSMGLTQAKTLLKVKEKKSFLQIILDQAAARNVKLAIMNSFNTHDDTVAAVNALNPAQQPLFFQQHKFPKILRNNFAPALWPANPELEWNPPGHGEIYTALHTSGLLKTLLEDGCCYALFVNADNLGATADPALLGYFAENNLPFMMEVAQRTPADMKGGHLALHAQGGMILREIAQCPEDELNCFQDISHYRFFNVNSLWVNLVALEDLIKTQNVIHLPIILNPKTLDPRDKNSPRVFQIETAMGAAISLFAGATAVKVGMERFRPVKKCSDLLAIRSDCFIFDEQGCLIPNPERKLGRIQIKLDDTYYGKIDSFENRFSQGIPSLIDCEALKIEGDVRFEKDVVIKGRVTIKNTNSLPAVIAASTVIGQDMILK